MVEKFNPFIVHFEYLTPCPQCGVRCSGLYKIGDNSYLCDECYENIQADKDKEEI